MSAADSDVLFDRARVRDRVTQRVNELWQTAITNTIRHGPPLADLRIPPKDVLRATRQLACALDHKIIEIRHTSGLLGGHLDEKTFTDSSATDPNCKMANVVITLWQKLVFEPQRDNIERLIAGLRMAKKHPRAQDPADELLDELKKSTILPSHREVRELVVRAIDLIQDTSFDVDNAPGGTGGAECHVTLLQMAAIVNKSKRTLEKLWQDGKLPDPAVVGGSGRANEWRWSEAKPVLEKEYGRSLPTVFPSDRFVRR